MTTSTPKVIGFYNENDKPYGCFSNWYPCTFSVDGVTFANAEQYMMWAKACTFGAKDTADKIIATTDPAQCKALGRNGIPGFDANEWDSKCIQIMRKGLREKFRQNPELAKVLLSTGDSYLAECTDDYHLKTGHGIDRKWGIGLAVNDPRTQHPEAWCGRNVLGYTLMLARKDLRLLAGGKTIEEIEGETGTGGLPWQPIWI